MKTVPRFSWLRGHKGSAIVFVAVTLMLLVAFAGLAIDVGYLYIVKGELQNAADAGALAGAQVLFDDPDNPSDIPGRFVFAGANAVALKYVQDNYSEKAQTEVVSIERGHWSFTTREFTPNDLLDPWKTVDLWKHTEAQLDVNPDFINAVRVITRRKRAVPGDPNSALPEPFFIHVVGGQAAEVTATAVAYIGFAGTLAPWEVDQPIALCEDKLLLGEQAYNCNTGRMLSDPEQTARWTDYTQPESGQCTAADSEVKPLICGSGNPNPLILGEPFATTNGTQGNSITSMEQCWRSSAPDRIGADFLPGSDGIPDAPWQINLPVVNGPCGGGGCVFKLIGAVTVNVLWVNDKNDPHFDNVPRAMTNPDWGVAGDWSCKPPKTGQECWLSFVDKYKIKGASGQLATLDDYNTKSMYFIPDCTPHVPAGVTGGRNFGVLARVPVLVK